MRHSAAAIAVTITLATAGPAHAFTCEKDEVACRVTQGVVFAIGSIYLTLSSLGDVFSSSTPVRVQTDDGRVIEGRLTAKAASGRTVKSGDLLLLRCKLAPRIKDYFLCELEFTRKDPYNSHYRKDHKDFGLQASWSIRLYDNGKTNEELLILDEPVALPR